MCRPRTLARAPEVDAGGAPALTLVTHKKLRTKVDLNFIPDTPELVMRGQLGFYTAERMLVTKFMTFTGRGELKDLYDIAHLLRTVKASSFKAA